MLRTTNPRFRIKTLTCQHRLLEHRKLNDWMMSKDDISNKPTVNNQFAWILNYQPKIEHQHIHMGRQTDDDVQDAEEVFVPRQLQFFDMVALGSEEKQPKLIAMLRDVAQQIDTTSGRGWFCIYAGYRYYKQQLAVTGGYADFFADIEALIPDKLTIIDTTKEGEARYHNYTQLLGREASAWYMDKEKLPPLNEITVWKNRFKGDKNRYAANVPIIIDVYKRLKTI